MPAQMSDREAAGTVVRRALVTGGSRGIGAAIVRELAGRGFAVAFTFQRQQAAAEDLAAATGALALPLDLGGEAARIADFARELESRLGGVDVLVHNAGMTKDGLLALSKEADWDLVQQVNLKGPYLLTRALLKGMIRQRWGRVVSLASASGVIGHAGQTAYSAAKGGLIAFTKALALEVARYGITANAVAPGFIETEMLEAIPPEKLAAFRAGVPLGRFGRPEEVAALVAYLASEEAGYLTGQCLRIDGGLITA